LEQSLSDRLFRLSGSLSAEGELSKDTLKDVVGAVKEACELWTLEIGDAIKRLVKENPKLANLFKDEDKIKKAIEDSNSFEEKAKKIDKLAKEVISEPKTKNNSKVKEVEAKIKDLVDKRSKSTPKEYNEKRKALEKELSRAKGETSYDTLIEDIKDKLKKESPDITDKEIRDALIHVQKSRKVSEKSKLKQTLKKTGQVQAKIENKQFDKDPIQRPEESEELYDARKALAITRYELDQEVRSNLMSNRHWGTKAFDYIQSLNRFSVLTYPSTFVKLLTVVMQHHLTRGVPMLMQKLWANTPGIKKIASKGAIWGDVEWSAVAKYNSELWKNMSLQVLKEHAKGIDVKEIMYGKPYIYEEWSSDGSMFKNVPLLKNTKSLLEMPGRSHGYIKSFIKSPEFGFAHEQIINTFGKRFEAIKRELSDENLSKEDINRLKLELESKDISRPYVQDAINKLAIEHAKWAIMMNDSKSVKAVQGLMRDVPLFGAFLKTELPIMKIPMNYVSRHFLIKYGMIDAIVGTRKFLIDDKVKSPGLIECAIKGTKDLTPYQADRIMKSLTMGSCGVGLFLLGYFNKDKVKVNDDGSLEVFGNHVNKNLVHLPLYESMFSGSIAAEQYESMDEHGMDKFAENILWSDLHVAKKMPFTQLLQYGFIAKAVQQMYDKGEVDVKNAKLGNAAVKKATNMVIPGFVQQMAAWQDTEGSFMSTEWINSKPTKREDKTAEDIIKSALPKTSINSNFNRQDVDVNKN